MTAGRELTRLPGDAPLRDDAGGSANLEEGTEVISIRMTSVVVATAGLLVTACGGGTAGDSAEYEVDASGASIKGTVTNAKTGQKLSGVTVSAGDRSTTTGSEGTYTLSESAGTYTVTASRSGYARASRSVTVKKGMSVRVDFALSPSGGSSSSSGGASSSGGSSSSGAVSGSSYKVFANNDLGMHCVDGSFAVFSILPPYNVVNAQVVALQSSGKPVLLDATKADLRYTAVADASGSTNSRSIGKSNFWQYAGALYGATLAEGAGLQGLWMPADAGSDLAKTTLSWDAALGLFAAPGIPIFPKDDAGKVNSYPLLRFSAYDKSGKLLASTDAVVPVSDETSCRSCHAASASDTEDQVRQRILDLHNTKLGTSLVAPVLCASCHYSPATDLAGNGPTAAQAGHKTMSRAMHGFHASKMGSLNDKAVGSGSGYLSAPPASTTQACYQCHPGANTKCLRGAMTSSLDCQNCHGTMAAVGGTVSNRTPWTDEPRCGSCHANDAVSKTTSDQPLAADGLRFTLAYSPADATAVAKTPTNTRFAENDGKLYRKSKGHGGLACEACHGSTHALWSGNTNDNVAATALQGHAGTIGECSTCHQAAPSNGLNGPHGMHPVGSAWVSAHKSSAKGNQASCQPCHGTDHRGTVLSRMFSTRTLNGKSFAAGVKVGCYDCHGGPNG